MKRTSYSSAPPSAPMATAIGCGIIALIALALCPFLWPLLLLSPVFLYWALRQDVDGFVDPIASKHAQQIAEEWRRKRLPGERGIEVSTTLHSSEVFSDGPRTQIDRFELEDDDL